MRDSPFAQVPRVRVVYGAMSNETITGPSNEAAHALIRRQNMIETRCWYLGTVFDKGVPGLHGADAGEVFVEPLDDGAEEVVVA